MSERSSTMGGSSTRMCQCEKGPNDPEKSMVILAPSPRISSATKNVDGSGSSSSTTVSSTSGHAIASELSPHRPLEENSAWWRTDSVVNVSLRDGSKYDGQMQQGQRHGHGICRLNGWSYEGQWSTDVPDGQGVERLPDGSVFKGYFQSGDRQGDGLLLWVSGDSYQGQFNQNDMHGEGTYRWSDGRVYAGEWQKNRLGPRGLVKWADGRTYEGEFLHEKKHGWGKLSWPDGRSYTGQWEDGLQHGIGIVVAPGGSSRRCEWKAGSFVKWLEDNASAQMTVN